MKYSVFSLLIATTLHDFENTLAIILSISLIILMIISNVFFKLFETFANYIPSKSEEELRKEYATMLDEYNKLLKNYNNTIQKLDAIINSKGWKMLENLRKLKPGKK